ncbi:MAG: Rieske (2Fe-2S) protein [Bacteroidota bacterium]
MRNSHDTSAPTIQNRRDFLGKLLGAWSVFVVAPIAKVVLDYVTPLKGPDTSKETIRVASVADLAPNTAKVFKVNKEPVIVVHTQSGQYKAFSARCTHLGCVVKYNTEEGPPHFSCNCHGSQFDINGKNFDGPAPRPLNPFRVMLKDSSVFVSKT